MSATRYPIDVALKIMAEWLCVPERYYKRSVHWFARELPPDDVLEAVQIARARFPEGGRSGFKYFCGVCHRKIENRIWDDWQ